MKEIKKREVYYGDSWFTSRCLCLFLKSQYGHEYFGAIKTSHSGMQKADVEEIMKDWPSGSYLVLECEELELFSVGYKYNYKRKFKSTAMFIQLRLSDVLKTVFLPSLLLSWNLECWLYNPRQAIHCQVA